MSSRFICQVAALLLTASLVAQSPIALPPVYEVVEQDAPPPAANPANGIALIEAPTANPTGAASLSYPIKLPPARKGHAPVLDIAYSSDHLHGWLGRGWTLGLPSISVETRWGVPRYHPDTETETYLLEGEMLAPVAHRGASRPRTPDATFHPRVEGRFRRIVRHGDGPRNYWWEIASPDGTVEYYGGTPEGPVPTAQIRDAAGNTANWALVRSVDVYGNRIDYHYASQADNGRPASTEAGTNRYPDRITYNGFNDAAGPYEIRFLRDRQLGEARRPDVRVDYEGGFKRVTADLLRRIEITYRNQPVRHYALNYRTGAFHQSLLVGIVEYGSEGGELARHELAYHERTEDAAFGPAETWSTGNDNVEANILNPLPGFTGEVSALGGSGSTSTQIGSAVTVGPIGPPASKELTVGGTVGSGSSAANGILAFVDIDGDGLPDKLFKRGNDLVWRKNRFGTGQTSFGPVRPVNGIRDFSVQETSEFNFGFEANITPFFAGYENTTARTTTTTYFNDFNGDELLDILHNGRIYFNHLDAAGNPTFTLNSGDTPSLIVAGASPDDNLVEIDPDAQQELLDMTPRHDVVRSWEAPCDGTVSVVSVIRLVEQAGVDDYNREDGVNATIELGATAPGLALPATQLFTASIPANDYAPRNANLGGIPVVAGQRLYFRVQSVLDGAFDRVSWDPEITYEGEDPAATDLNGKPRFRFRASEDFLLTSCQTVAMPLAGRVDLLGSFTKPPLADTVHLELLRGGERLFSVAFAPDSTVSDLPVEFPNFQVAEDQQLQLRMRANASVDWAAPAWTPRLVYRSADDGTLVVSPDGEDLYSYCPAIDYTMRNVTERKGDIWQPASDSFALNFLYVQFGQGADYATLALRGRDTVYHQYDTLFAGAAAGAMVVTDSVALPPGADVWVEVFGPGAAAVELTLTPLGTANPIDVPYAVYRKRTPEELLLGPQYRGWGQFVYRGEDGFDALGIIEANLRLQDPDIDEEDVEDIEIDPDDPDFSEFEGLTDDPTQEPFVVMVADPKSGSWVGYDNLTLVGRDYQSSSRLGEDDVILTPDVGTGASAPPLSSVARINAVSAGAGFGPASLAGSTAWNTTTNQLEVMDLNGDRYPDVVSPTRAQYTTVYGGLSDQSVRHGFGNHEARSRAIGGTAGGKFVDSAPTNSGDTSGKGSRRRARRAKTKTKNQGAKAQSANESAESGGSISVNFSRDEDRTVHSWFDLNGDGLADKVWDNGDVAFNYGYRFGARENWGFAAIREGVSIDYGGGGGINVSNNSFAAGIAITRTDNYTTAGLQDMNNDGMADVLSYNPDNRMLRVALNTGSGFAPAVDWGQLSEAYDAGDATSESVNFAFTVCVPIFFIRICVNPSGSTGRGVSRVLSQFDDVDGDGYPDEVTAQRDNEMRVRRSTLGKVNLLREVRRPLGATIALDYELAPNAYGLPFAKWLLTEVSIDDGVAGDGPGSKTRMVYDEPNHDRHEREFYGYARTTEEELDPENGDAVYRRRVVEYRNGNFYEQGLPRRSYVEDAAGNRYRETVYTYLLTNPATQTELPPNLLLSDQERAYPLLNERTDNFYEGAATPRLSRRTAFAYDSLGQIVTQTDFGDGTPEDELRTEYAYHPLPADRFKADRLASVTVFGGGELLRHRETEVDERGNVTQRRDYLDEATFAARDYTYDDWSNVLTYQRPPNAAGERMTYRYTIDSTERMYPVRTEDAYGYFSTARYEFRYGQLLATTDINGHSATYALDEYGRVEEVKLPLDSVYSYRYAYRPNASPAYATTERYDPARDAPLLSHVFLDGLGRTVQTQQQSTVEGQLRLVASGTVRHDAFGRASAEGYPQALPPGSVDLTFAPATAPAARSTYDVLDRPRSVTLPDGATTTFAYAIAPGPDGQLRFRETKTDALGFRETVLTDERGQEEAYLREADTTTITTLMDYNLVGELLTVTDAGGFRTTHTYDRLGRRTATAPADGGETRLVYDLAGNLLRKHTPNLRDILGEDGAIRYAYDHERLTGITYPINFQNKVEYAYGGPNARFNRRGRLVLRLDASGGEEYFYDAQGETSKTIRTIIVNESTVRTFIHEMVYDSWGRERRMGYPDGEWVTYGYDAGGRLSSLTGEKDGNRYDYLTAVDYDVFGRAVAKSFGNGSRETMAFDPQTQRPTSQGLTGAEGPLRDLRLAYDAVGNLESKEQTAGVGTNDLGGAYRQDFAYDPLHRLTEASGRFTTATGEETFAYFVDHDDLYNQSRRALTIATDGTENRLRSFDQRLEADPVHPHRIRTLGGRSYDYDANGNLLGFTGAAGSYRYQQSRWDEEDRMTEFSDNGTISRYTYTADGQRAIQSTGVLKGVFTDGAPVGFISHSGDYTAYVSPFFTFTKSTFTKHYFLGDERILTKEGTGEFNNLYWYEGRLTAGDLNYTARINDLTQTVWNYYAELGLPPGPPTLPGYYGQPGQTGEGLPTSTGGDFGSAPDRPYPGPQGPPDPSGPPGPPTWYASPPGRDSLGAGYGYEGYGVFPEVVASYYHTDQLGNVEWITDGRGQAVAYRAYLPSGEVAVEQTTTAPPIAYTFNGKEEDEAAGLNYFGARYLEPEVGRWLSLDPLLDAYPGHNPYAFGLHNPLRFVDPDGRAADDPHLVPLATASGTVPIYAPAETASNPGSLAPKKRTTLKGRKRKRRVRPAVVTGPAQASQVGNVNDDSGLTPQLRAGIEALSGADVSAVRVHRNSFGRKTVNPLAYVGDGSGGIHLAPGQEKHLPHEAWHVVQQAGGIRPHSATARAMAQELEAALKEEAHTQRGRQRREAATESPEGRSVQARPTRTGRMKAFVRRVFRR